MARLDDQCRHAVSIASLTELRLGVEKQYGESAERRAKASEDLDRLLSRFEILPLTRSVAIGAAEIIADLRRRGEPLYDLHDVYIGATARTKRLTVLTANVDHFDRTDGVRVLDWNEF